MSKARFRVAQKAIIRNKDGKYLALKFSKNDSFIGKYLQGKWDVPGGGLENAEALGAGLLREIREELGKDVRVKIGKPLHTWSFKLQGDIDGEGTCIVVGYDTEWLGGEILLSEEHSEFRWMSPAEISAIHWEHFNLEKKDLEALFRKTTV